MRGMISTTGMALATRSRRDRDLPRSRPYLRSIKTKPKPESFEWHEISFHNGLRGRDSNAIIAFEQAAHAHGRRNEILGGASLRSHSVLSRSEKD